MISCMFLQYIISTENTQSEMFGIIIDGTRDNQEEEQQSIFINYINELLEIKEDFI